MNRGALMGLGDAIAQLVLEDRPVSMYDVKRSARFFFFGTVLAVSTLISLGDVLAQFVVEKRDLASYDKKRTLRFAIFGTFFGGPVFSLWYTRLATSFGHTKYASLKMVACDQDYPDIIKTNYKAFRHLDDFKQFMNTTKSDILQGSDSLSVEEIWLRFTDAIKRVTKKGHLTFDGRVLVVNLVAVGWNTYLAWMSEKVHPHPELQPEQHPELLPEQQQEAEEAH
ncbi:MPV17-like protein [Mya arenaria]|uniref:MPV17-like protein n=1 Tax=Mya arenaria TaxID=6604 RepID=A0ABY7F4K2_MYAAR|nr:MPV17-like protein [Mya arenaria]